MGVQGFLSSLQAVAWLFPLLSSLALAGVTWFLYRGALRLQNYFLKSRNFFPYLLTIALLPSLLIGLWSAALYQWFEHYGEAWAQVYIIHLLTQVPNLPSLVMLLCAELAFFRLIHIGRKKLLSGLFFKASLDRQVVNLITNLGDCALFLFTLLSLSKLLELPFTGAVASTLICLFIIVFTSILLYVSHTLLEKMGSLTLRQGNYLFYALTKASATPILLSISGFALVNIVRLLGLHHYLFYISFFDVFLVAASWTLFRSIGLLEEQLLSGRFTHHYPDKSMVRMSGRFGRIAVLVVAGLFFASHKGYGLQTVGQGLLTALVSVSFAGKETLANYLNGLAMYSEDHFQVGDLIYSPDKKVEGFVEYIGLRTTAIRTLDKCVIYVPNAFFATHPVINATRRAKRKISIDIPLDRMHYDIVGNITRQIQLMLQKHPGIDQAELNMVHFVGLGPSCLKVNLRSYTKTKDLRTYRNIQQDILSKAFRIIDELGGSLAYPTRTVQWIGPTPSDWQAPAPYNQDPPSYDASSPHFKH